MIITRKMALVGNVEDESTTPIIVTKASVQDVVQTIRDIAPEVADTLHMVYEQRDNGMNVVLFGDNPQLGDGEVYYLKGLGGYNRDLMQKVAHALEDAHDPACTADYYDVPNSCGAAIYTHDAIDTRVAQTVERQQAKEMKARTGSDFDLHPGFSGMLGPYGRKTTTPILVTNASLEEVVAAIKDSCPINIKRGALRVQFAQNVGGSLHVVQIGRDTMSQDNCRMGQTPFYNRGYMEKTARALAQRSGITAVFKEVGNSTSSALDTERNIAHFVRELARAQSGPQI